MSSKDESKDEWSGIGPDRIQKVWSEIKGTKQIGEMSRENAVVVIERATDRVVNVAFLAYDTDSFDQVVRDSVRDSILECVLQSMDRRYNIRGMYDHVGWYGVIKEKIVHLPETLRRHKRKHEARIRAREALKKKMKNVDRMVSGLGSGTVSMTANRSPFLTFIYFAICTSVFFFSLSPFTIRTMHARKPGLFVVSDLIFHAYHGTYDQLWYFSMMKSIWMRVYGPSSSVLGGNSLEDLKTWLDERSREL